MIRIRLTRVGKKNSPAYRVVVADKRRAVKRKFIEIIGNYNPILKPKTIVIDKDRALFWIKQGAQPTLTVNNLMCDLGILTKNDKIKKVFGKKNSKKSIAALADGEMQDKSKDTDKQEKPVVEVSQIKEQEEKIEEETKATEEQEEEIEDTNEKSPSEPNLKSKKDKEK